MVPPGRRKIAGGEDHALASIVTGSESPLPLQNALGAARESIGNVSGHLGLAIAPAASFRNRKRSHSTRLVRLRSPSGLETPLIYPGFPSALDGIPRFHELVRALKLPEYWRAAGWGEFCRAKGDDIEAGRHEPEDFFAELKRRNVYKVAVAYAVVAWLLIQISDIDFSRS